MEFMDQTVFNTPQPQASSTVERKRIPRRIIEEEFLKGKNDLDYTPVQEMSESRSSSRTSGVPSSLGLISLDNIESFCNLSLDEKINQKQELKDSAIQMPHPTDSLTEKIIKQRELAMKALERADNHMQNKNVGGLPSYLLKSDGKNITNNLTKTKNESTINASDLERFAQESDKLSFNFNEITARSSSLTNDSRQISDFIDPQRNSRQSQTQSSYSSRCEEIFDKIRKSDVQLQQMYNNNTKTPKSVETFDISDDSFNPERQDSLFEKLKNECFTPAENAIKQLENDEIEWKKNQDTIPIEKDKNITDLSRFSSFMTDDSRGKLSMTDFFQQKSEKIDAFNYKSPEKKYKPVPLIDLTNNYTFDKYQNEPTEVEDVEVEEARPSEVPKLSESSVLSVTQIQRELEKLGSEGHTPRRVMEYLMNPKKFTETYSKNLEVSNKENISQKTLTPGKMSVSPNQKTLTPKVLTENNVNSPRPRKSFENEVITIDDSYEKSQNNTLSSIKESPSMSCSELQFSDDSASSNEFQNSDEWFEISNLSHYETCMLVESDAWVNMTLKSNNWVLNEVKLVNVTLEDQVINKISDFILVKLPQDKSEFIKSNSKHSFLVQYMTFVVGHFELNLALKLKDQLSKMSREIQTTIHIESERPDLNFKEKTINFDVIPEESFKIKELSIFNASKVDLTVYVSVVQEGNVFCVGKDSENPNLNTPLKSVLKSKEETLLPIFMQVPDLKSLDCSSHVKELTGKLIFFMEYKIKKILANVDLVGRVGLTRIKFKTACLPMVLVPNEPKILNVLNAGVVTMELEGVVVDSKTKTNDPNFTIEPNLFELKPSQKIDLKVIYNSDSDRVKPISRVLRLLYKNGRSFRCDLVVNAKSGRLSITGSKSPRDLIKSRRSSGLSSPHRSYENLASVDGSPKNIIKSRRSLTALSSPHRSYENLSSPKRNREISSPRRSYDLVSPHKSLEDISSRRTFGEFVDNVMKGSSSPSFKDNDFGKMLRSPGLSTGGRSPANEFLKSPSISQRKSLSRDICKSVSPTQSSASTDAGTPFLPNGRLPIESNRQELVWDCVKLGKSQTQEFIIRNRSTQKVRFNATINEIAFKIVKDQTELISTLRISLMARESRKILVNFTPNSIGATTSKLIFTPLESCAVSNIKPQTINLFGYGGHSHVDIQGVFKDTSGKLWLSFGKIESHQNAFIQSVYLKNTGSLLAFYHIDLCLKPFLSSSIKIFPNQGIIPPQKEVEISIRFTPRCEDFEYLRSSKTSDVFEIATLKLLTGAEATRGRLRKFHSKMSNAGLTCFSADLLSKLAGAFPNEHMPSDLRYCNEQETTSSLKELFKGIISREITLTLEENIDLGMTFENLDDSCAFKSLFTDSTHLLDDSHCEKTLRRASSGFCTVEPNKFVLSPPVKVTDTILLYSRHSRPMSFEIETSIDELSVEPKIGLVQPGETTILTVNWCPREQSQIHPQLYRQPIVADITVFCENQEINVKAHIIYVQTKSRMK